MKAYFTRRLLLIPFTMLGITIVAFILMSQLPGGPMENSLARLMGGGGEGGGKRSRVEAGASMSMNDVLTLEENWNRDKTPLRSYFEWLGVVPRDVDKTGKEFPEGKTEVTLTLPGSLKDVKVIRTGDQAKLVSGDPDEPNMDLKGWEVRLRSPEEQQKRWSKWVPGGLAAGAKKPEYRAVIYRPEYSGLIEGDLGQSEIYKEPVMKMILSKIPVSAYFGMLTLVISYCVSVPLGILKAVRHRTWLDNWSSVAIMVGYAIPGYALGTVMVVYLGAKWGYFPIRGLFSENFETLSTGGKILDVASHTVMPLVCYLVGSFATVTMMVKNNLMDNLAADYVRTAMAKGVSYPRAVLRHAFRNSLIPLASTIGGLLLVLVGGSILIEKVFDIDGFGLLEFSALLGRDRTLTMGTIVVSALLMLVGNVISDLCVALVDPKVSYS